jgi:uncharacterized protein YprB with RNaseH-like and TPR domain
VSGLRNKLDLLRRTSGGLSAAPERNSPRPSAGDRTDRNKERDGRLLEVLGGAFQQTGRGALHVLTHRHEVTVPWGPHGCLCSARMFSPELLSPLYQGLDGVRIEDALFFDTETTGLAGGSGTYAFLVGIGYFEGEQFVTEQLLMRDHGDEPALLDFLSRRLQGRSGLVSFNGKTFDAQLLSTRYAMHRMASPLEGVGHLDLLHICRRLFAYARLPDCRLETLEHRVLGAPRTQDTPGWLIPELFFGFLRDRNPAPLKGVLEHNRRDLLAMVGLCGVLQKMLTARCSQSAPGDPHVRLGLARLWSMLGEAELSDQLYQSALAGLLGQVGVGQRALTYWARDLKKREQTEQAALLWRRLLAHSPGHLEATVELAKWFEHRRRNYRAALLLVEGGLRDRTLTVPRRRELEHRARRLRARMASAGSSVSYAHA